MTMKKLALLFGLLFAFPAFAADNAVIVTPGVGVTMKSKDIGGGVQAMQPVLSDTGGNALSTPTAGADAVSNTATGLLGYSRGLVFNGTTWDRWLGDATNGGFVNVKTSVLPTGAATSALQTTTNTKLDTIITNTGAAVPAGSAIIGKVGFDQTTPGTTNLIAVTNSDPCTYANKTNLAISQNGTSSVQLIALSGSTVIYVCSLSLIAAGATTVALTTGTGSACVTGNAAVIGTTTANIANSMSLAANGGLTLGNGMGTVAKGAASSELCMINGSNVFVSGNLTYVQQ